MATYQFGDKSAINLMMAITNGLDREFMKRSEFTDLTKRLADVEARLSGIGSGGSSSGGIQTIQLNGTRLPSTGGTVNINIPMQLSSYLNDANFQNAAEVRSIFQQMLEEAIASGQIGQGSSGSGNTVKLKTKPNSIVIFTHPDGTVITGKADESGDLVVDLPKTGNWSIKSISGNTTTTGSVIVDGNGQKNVDLTDGPTKPTEDYVVSLKTEPYATVAFVHPDGTVVTARADGNGDLIVVLPKAGAWKIISVANNSIPSSVTITKPGVSEVDITQSVPPVQTDERYPVHVKVTPGATVIFTGADGTTVSAVADENGDVNVYLPYKGNWDITVLDKDGKTLNGSVTVTDADTKEEVDLSGQSATTPTQYIITLKVKPGATVTLIHPDGDTVTGVADADGNLTVVVPKKGTWTILSMSGGKTDVGSVDVENPDNINVNVGGNTSSGESCTHVMEVMTTPGATVVAIHPDGTRVSAVADSNGKAILILPKTGDWTIVSVDTEGNIDGSGVGTVSGNGTSKKDITGTGISNIPPDTKVIVVKTDPGAQVTLVGPNGEVITGIADENGIFLVTVPSTGEWTVVTNSNGTTSSATTTVPSGNGTSGSGVTVKPGGETPPTPPVENTYNITVKTEPNSTVYFIHPDGTIIEAKADASGVCSVDLPKSGDWKIIVVKPDGSGADTNVDVGPDKPTNPSVDVTTPSGKLYPVIVTTDPGASVTLVNAAGTTITGKADENGVAVVIVPTSGDWTVICTKDGKTANTTVNVNSSGSATLVELLVNPPVAENTINIHTLPTSTVIAKRKSDGKLISSSSDASGNLSMTLEDGDWNIVAINGDVCVDKLVKIPTTTPSIEILEASGSIFTLYVTTLKNVPITSVYTDGTTVIDEADSTGFSVVLLEKRGDWNITAKDSDNNDKSILININDSSHVLKLDFCTGDIGGGGAEEEPVVKQFFANIIGMPYSTIYAINPITGDATSGTADDDGKVTLEFPCSGLWRAFSIDGSTYYDGVVIISPTGAVTSTRIVGNTGTVFIVYLTTDKGANYTFTHTDGSQVTGQADYDSGFDTVFLPKTGTWTLNTNAAGKTSTKNVVVENVGELLRVRSKA